MTYEAVKVELTNGTGNQRRFTCADGVKITKGTVLKLSEPRTAGASVTEFDYIAGIASMDKVADDGETSISAWTDGIFDMYASGSITAGTNVMSAGYNHVKAVGATTLSASGAVVIGYALEDASDDEVINVRVRL